MPYLLCKSEIFQHFLKVWNWPIWNFSVFPENLKFTKLKMWTFLRPKLPDSSKHSCFHFLCNLKYQISPKMLLVEVVSRAWCGIRLTAYLKCKQIIQNTGNFYTLNCTLIRISFLGFLYKSTNLNIIRQRFFSASFLYLTRKVTYLPYNL